MNMKKVLAAKSMEEAREYAIKWQKWVANKNLSYQEMSWWNDIFETLAERYDLWAEFTENGII